MGTKTSKSFDLLPTEILCSILTIVCNEEYPIWIPEFHFWKEQDKHKNYYLCRLVCKLWNKTVTNDVILLAPVRVRMYYDKITRTTRLCTVFRKIYHVEEMEILDDEKRKKQLVKDKSSRWHTIPLNEHTKKIEKYRKIQRHDDICERLSRGNIEVVGLDEDERDLMIMRYDMKHIEDTISNISGKVPSTITDSCRVLLAYYRNFLTTN